MGKMAQSLLPRETAVAKLFIDVIRVTGCKKAIGRSEGLRASGENGGRRLGRTESVLVTLGVGIGGWGCRMDVFGAHRRDRVGNRAMTRRSPL